MATNVKVINEVSKQFFGNEKLCFQWCIYVHDTGKVEHGFRFMWRNEAGKLLSHRGQARIPSIHIAESLIAMARKAGWGGNVGDLV